MKRQRGLVSQNTRPVTLQQGGGEFAESGGVMETIKKKKKSISVF